MSAGRLRLSVVPLALVAALALTGTGCVAGPTGTPSPTVTVRISPEHHRYVPQNPPDGIDYAPFLERLDATMLQATIMVSFTPSCRPVIRSSTVGQDGALSVVLGHGVAARNQGCTPDAVPRQLLLPLPEDTDEDIVVRIQWDNDGTVYEYPM